MKDENANVGMTVEYADQHTGKLVQGVIVSIETGTSSFWIGKPGEVDILRAHEMKPCRFLRT